MTAREERFYSKIGFIQGRLTPMIDGKIQAFPWPYWRDEFFLASKHGFSLMEWTLDQERLHENPLMTREGRREIASLADINGVEVKSLTGDCFMQAPFYRAEGKLRENLLHDLKEVLKSCAALGISKVVMPLVDQGSLEEARHEESLLGGLDEVEDILQDTGVLILFESDYPPDRLARFIDKLSPGLFGINYDIGNSASLGYDPGEEFAAYGKRVLGVHVKDRTLGGGTVPLGQGNADIPLVLELLAAAGYTGDYILQTARAMDGDDVGALLKYRSMLAQWLGKVD